MAKTTYRWELEKFQDLTRVTLELLEKSLAPEEILKIIGQVVLRVMDFDRFRLYFYNEKTKLLKAVYENGMAYESQYRAGAVPKGLMAELIRLYKEKQKTILHIEDVTDFKTYPYLDRVSIEADRKKFGANKVKELLLMILGDKTKAIRALIAINNWDTGRPLFPKDKAGLIKILRTFINQASLAYQRAELYQNLNRQVKQLSALYEMSSFVATSVKPAEIVEVLVDGLTKSFEFRRLLVLLVNDQKNFVEIKYSSEDFSPEEKEKITEKFSAKDSILNKIYKAKRPQLVERAKIKEYLEYFPDSQTINSCLFIPGVVSGRVKLIVGFLNGETYYGLDEKSRNFLEILVNSAAVAIENLLVYKNFEEKADHLEALYNVGVALTGTLNIDEILRLIVLEVRQGLGFDRAGLFLVDWEGQVIRGKIGTDASGKVEKIDYQEFPLEENGSHFSDIAYGKLEHYFTDDISRVAPPSQKKFLAPGVTQNVVVPLKSKGKVIGLIAVDNLLTKKEISQSDLQLLKLFGAQAAVALENARLFQELEESKRDTEDIIESDPVPTIVLNNDNLIIFVNESYERTYNIKRSQLLGKNYFEIFPYAKKEGREEIVTEVKESGREYSEDNVEHLTHDNRLIYENIRISKRARGGVIITVEDVTKRVKLRRALREQAIQLEKVSMIAKITRTMAHEINNPLTSVVCYTQVLGKQFKEDSTVFSKLIKDLKALPTSLKTEDAGTKHFKEMLEKLKNMEKVYRNAIEGLTRAYEQSSRIADVIRKLTKMGDEARIVVEQDYPGGVKILDIEKTITAIEDEKKPK
jgi:PAS domain S-box-containing protein